MDGILQGCLLQAVRLEWWSSTQAWRVWVCAMISCMMVGDGQCLDPLGGGSRHSRPRHLQHTMPVLPTK